jgi:hypothetical protein
MTTVQKINKILASGKELTPLQKKAVLNAILKDPEARNIALTGALKMNDFSLATKLAMITLKLPGWSEKK